ncbi:hypothetical protein PQX77_007671 [Marasmius sp. AFHP31]|nr:hypothetical protein PQX77_007671 [Marasmius sp. AFHP31]
MAGAFVNFNWVGTAIYVYGNSTRESYSFSVDGQDVGQTFDVQQGGLLGSKIGMQYKEHNATLKVVGGEGLAFQYADLTIGLGYNGKERKNETVQAVVEEGDSYRPNPFFDYHSSSLDWRPDTFKAIVTLPNGTTSPITRQMITAGRNDSLGFHVNSSNAFILWGSLYKDHATKRITISPDPRSNNLTSTKETFMYDTGRYQDYQQILYWESGLNRETSYVVNITALDAVHQKFAFNELQLLDGGLPLATGARQHLLPRDIAMIVVLPVFLFATIGIGTLWFHKRQTKRMQALVVTPYVGIFKNAPPSQSSSSPPPASTTATSQSCEIDAGPLPPQYNPLWAHVSSGDGSVPFHSAIRAIEMVQTERK